jgi:hypothetical protein
MVQCGKALNAGAGTKLRTLNISHVNIHLDAKDLNSSPALSLFSFMSLGKFLPSLSHL